MRRIKQISIKNYITGMILSVILVLSMIMLLIIHVLAREAIHADIQTELVNEARENGRMLRYKDNEIITPVDFGIGEEGRTFLVIDRPGDVLYGEYPEGISQKEIEKKLPVQDAVISGKLHTVSLNNQSYYMVDVVSARMTRKSGNTILVRCLALTSTVSSKYEMIMMVSYLSIPILVLFAVIFSWLFARSLSEPIKRLCKVAESIRCEDDLSHRTEYSGRFYEIAVLSEANNRMFEKLERSFEIQKQFNSDVAHELRNPIAIVLAQCEYAGKHGFNKTEYAETLETIYRQTKKEDKMVQQLLKLTRLEQRNVVLEREWGNIDDIIESVCEDEEQKAEQGVDFHLSIEETEAYIDVNLMTMVIQNLVHNAIVYSPERADISIRVYRQDAEVLIQITDQGCGIGKEKLGFIFNAFYRIDEARNTEGVGLGLSIARQIVELHNGKITVDSVVGQGSTFVLHLPIE